MFARLSAVAVTALVAGAALTPVSAATSAAHGTFEYYSDYFDGTTSACTERSTTGPTAACSFLGFTIAETSKTAVSLGGRMCAGTFAATLHLGSGSFGSLTIPGTLEIALGRGHFAGAASSGSRVVVAEARYSGPKCGLPTVIPVPTHITGTFGAAA